MARGNLARVLPRLRHLRGWMQLGPLSLLVARERRMMAGATGSRRRRRAPPCPLSCREEEDERGEGGEREREEGDAIGPIRQPVRR